MGFHRPVSENKIGRSFLISFCCLATSQCCGFSGGDSTPLPSWGGFVFKTKKGGTWWFRRRATPIEWRKPIGCLIFWGHFPQKRPIMSGCFLERDLQIKASYAPLSPCIEICCSVLQCVAVCCSVLQCVAVRCSVHHPSEGDFVWIYIYMYSLMHLQKSVLISKKVPGQCKAPPGRTVD